MGAVIMHRCRNCGREAPEADMIRFNTGRIQYMCMECYKTGCNQIGMHELKKAARKEREKNAKNRR